MRKILIIKTAGFLAERIERKKGARQRFTSALF